jgi:hypothetical protein
MLGVAAVTMRPWADVWRGDWGSAILVMPAANQERGSSERGLSALMVGRSDASGHGAVMPQQGTQTANSPNSMESSHYDEILLQERC